MLLISDEKMKIEGLLNLGNYQSALMKTTILSVECMCGYRV